MAEQLRRMLIADDEHNTLDALLRYFRGRFELRSAADGLEAIELLRKEEFDLVLTDLRMPGADGFSVLDAALSKNHPPRCIVFTAYGSIESAVQAVRAGAFDFVPKPVKLDKLEEVVNRALADREADASDGKTENEEQQDVFGQMIAESPAMRDVLAFVRRVAPTRSTVLLTGESGTGKEVVAKAIHALSRRRGLFVPVNCAALPANLLESELFGHEKGAFTGAVELRKGRFEWADGGTIFLDEIGEIDLSVQVKLLRVLEDRTITRIGNFEPIACDARLISATNRDLKQMVRDGTFREDLFYRLDVVHLHLPPLRERLEDIEPLVRRYVAECAADNGKAAPVLSEALLARMKSYRWPGNIRELKHCVERMVVLSDGPRLDVKDLPDHIRDFAGDGIRRELETEHESSGVGGENLALSQNEKQLIEQALARAGGNRTHAAELLGISRRTLHRRLKDYSIT